MHMILTAIAAAALATLHSAVPCATMAEALAVECEGCRASTLNSPPTINDGVEVIFTAPGFTIQATLNIEEHGSCTRECWHDKNCKFRGSYTARDDGTNGPFRNDKVPFCDWSIPLEPGDDSVLTGITSDTGSWLSACNADTFQSVRFLKNAVDCFSGLAIGEVKFHARCGACPGN
jgi:hypothetical protein